MSRRDDRLLIDNLATQTAAQLASATVGVSDMAQVAESAFYVEFGPGSGAGTVLLETASDPNYPGAWAQLASVAWAAASKSHYVAITGVMRSVRARISVNVTGGTVSCRMISNTY